MVRGGRCLGTGLGSYLDWKVGLEYSQDLSSRNGSPGLSLIVLPLFLLQLSLSLCSPAGGLFFLSGCGGCISHPPWVQ